MTHRAVGSIPAIALKRNAVAALLRKWRDEELRFAATHESITRQGFEGQNVLIAWTNVRMCADELERAMNEDIRRKNRGK